MNANEPAFPIITPDMPVVGSGGLTKRELLAAMALNAMIREMSFEEMVINHERRTPAFVAEVVAQHALAAADALVAALSKEHP